MTWCNGNCEDETVAQAIKSRSSTTTSTTITPLVVVVDINEKSSQENHHHQAKTCPSCGYQIQYQEQAGIHDLPGLPAGVKFDPTDQEILEHLEGKIRTDIHKLHPLIDEFIPTLKGENGICYTHPEKLPGVTKDGLIRHFFHRPSKAYTTGTRKRRKVNSDEDGSETRWHKTGKTRPVFVGGKVKGYKKILVLYTNYGKLKKPEKTNWVMHQYHFGNNEEEKDGELVVSKVFFQTQPRQCSSSNSGLKDDLLPTKLKRQNKHGRDDPIINLKDGTTGFVEYYNPSLVSYDHHHQGGHDRVMMNQPRGQPTPNFVAHADGS